MHDNLYQSLMGFSRNTSTKGWGEEYGSTQWKKEITRVEFAVTTQISDVRPSIAKV